MDVAGVGFPAQSRTQPRQGSRSGVTNANPRTAQKRMCSHEFKISRVTTKEGRDTSRPVYGALRLQHPRPCNIVWLHWEREASPHGMTRSRRTRCILNRTDLFHRHDIYAAIMQHGHIKKSREKIRQESEGRREGR